MVLTAHTAVKLSAPLCLCRILLLTVAVLSLYSVHLLLKTAKEGGMLPSIPDPPGRPPGMLPASCAHFLL